MSDASADASRLESHLDQTRSRLGSHLSELQGRLSPGQVLDDLVRYFRGSEGADFGRSLLDNVRANPLPAALTGIGLTWLMASSPRRGRTTEAPEWAGKDAARVYDGWPGFDQGAYDAIWRVSTKSSRVFSANRKKPSRSIQHVLMRRVARLSASRGTGSRRRQLRVALKGVPQLPAPALVATYRN